ncbi:putative mannosyl-glycoprotein endo-beta-N-acetylglucosaminidase [Streptococcus infantis SK1076]|uniref:Putative mannosyl-glycoprotein endo-beta-N-acetylglucosaminidase n=1 Tax=Streptococcus infantis SK1076 TaxID=1005705 RepID=F5W0M8_9STRE|nr:glucosaminidase domain-containing protein [Streptococcus infantis]EGL86215.1 putative mannosyl-glycoprotein endo-beta-N-acetylglucosaminidase [Streptococcus infantis SK1076]
MKRILLASTVALSIAGFAKSTVYAEDSQTRNKAQTSEQAVANGVEKEDQKQSNSRDKSTKQSSNESLNKAEKESSQITPKKETPENKEKTTTETKIEEVNKDGWQKENGQWRYYENKKAVTNWKKIAGRWYYFNQDGVMLSDTVYDDYLLSKSGAMVEDSWVKIDDKWYFATNSGKIIRNKWEKINGAWYCFDENGAMLTNTVYNDYLLQSSGAMHERGWAKIDEKWYYATDSGKIIRNKWEKINGSWYRFDESGIMLSKTIYNDYLLKTSGAMAEKDWVHLDEKWYYATDSGKAIRDKWEKINGSWYSFHKDGDMLSSQWKEKYYLKDSGAMAQSEWFFDKKYDSWFYLKSDGAYAENQWQGSYYLKSYGYMAKNEWIFDKSYNAWYYLKEDGVYVTGNFTINGKNYSFQSNGKWISDTAAYYKVKPITANVYSASGEKLSYISQGSIVSIDGDEAKDGRLPVKISGLSGYMNKSDLVAVSSDSEFIPHYATDGNYLYHELSPYTSIRVAPHSSSMAIGKKYYSADGINFENFTAENPFLFRDLRKPTNYTAEELDKVYSLMNIKGSRLAGKGAIFKEAEERYQVNALYLIAHSALESAWGRSQIAKDKNNFFGIAAYDTTPYDSAKSFDNVDKGILGAAKWIRQNYIDNGRTYLGNKSSGMNVLYASDPYWGEKIASIMMTINSKLGEKD